MSWGLFLREEFGWSGLAVHRLGRVVQGLVVVCACVIGVLGCVASREPAKPEPPVELPPEVKPELPPDGVDRRRLRLWAKYGYQVSGFVRHTMVMRRVPVLTGGVEGFQPVDYRFASYWSPEVEWRG